MLAHSAVDAYTRPQAWEESLKRKAQELGKDPKTCHPGDPIFEDPEETKYAYGLMDLIEQQEHRRQYKNYLKDARETRAKKKDNAFILRKGIDVDPEGINLGMVPYEGLDEPVFKMRKKADPLWLERPMDSSGAGPKRRTMALDENRLMKKKFKSAPTTPAEVEDVGFSGLEE